MKKTLKLLLYVIAVILIVIQFFHPAKNTDTSPVFANDITSRYNVPEPVLSVLKTSCYDCHSNNTVYPWYSKIQPVAWWLNNHIEEGKGELNFNEFAGYKIRRQYKKLEEIINEIKEDEMPLTSYTLIHKKAVLSPDQKLLITNWANELRAGIKASTPPDSLIKR